MLLAPKPVAVLLVLTAVLLVVGCGADSSATSNNSAEGGDEPLSPRALAAVVAEHTGPPSSAGRGLDMEEVGGDRLVAAVELRYGTDGEYDGDLLAVGVGTNLDILKNCDEPQAEGLAGCAQTNDGIVFWESHTPEEDPGAVYVQVSKGNMDVLLIYVGPDITSDPRELDMPISVAAMFAIGADPRVGLTTSAEAVKAGDAIGFWDDHTGE